jgi:hypothetical protein
LQKPLSSTPQVDEVHQVEDEEVEDDDEPDGEP